MKRLYLISTVLFWIALMCFWRGGLPGEVVPEDAARPVVTAYTLGEVAGHDRPEDCWMAIDGEVYDLTAYLPQHPTLPTKILPWCGREATVAYNTKNLGSRRSRPHSPRASELLQHYRIGRLQEEPASLQNP